MSAQVDVLAVMDEGVACLALDERDVVAHQLTEARAAVAALIAERDALVQEVAALRQQPAPVDLEQFRLPVEAWKSHLDPNDDDESEAYDEADRLLSIIDNAGKVEVEPSAVRSLVNAANAALALYPGDDLLWTLESAVRPFNATKPAECAKECPPQQVCDYCQIASNAHQPAPVVDDARMARALEWVRNVVALGFPVTSPEHLPAIEEAISAYNPNCGARTVRVVDDAMVERYLTAVHEHLGGLPSEQWDRDREDGGATLRRIARIGLTAALARAQGVQS